MIRSFYGENVLKGVDNIFSMQDIAGKDINVTVVIAGFC